MNALAQWQESNARYLSAAVSWLRLCLEQYILRRQEESGPSAGQAKAEQRLLWEQLVQSSASETGPSEPALPSPRPGDNANDRVAQAAAYLTAAESQIQPPPALILLGQLFGLSRFEQQVLLMCAAVELDTSIAPLCARAQDDPNRPYPTFALALSIFDEPAWDVLSPRRPLRHWRLLEINQPGAQPLTTSPLRADERIVNYLKGLNYLDDRLTPLLTPLEAPRYRGDLPPSQLSMVDTIVRHLKQASTSQNFPIVQLLGSDVLSKQLVAWHAATSLGLRVYCLPGTLLPTQAAELEAFTRLWQRESLLLPVALYLDTQESGAGHTTEGLVAPSNRLLARIHGIVFLDSREVWADLGRPTFPVDIDRPSPAEQQKAWAAALGSAAGDNPALLAGQFNLNLPTIQQITHAVSSETANDGRRLKDRLWHACLIKTCPRLDALAQRLDPKATWADIVLPEAEINLLQLIARQVGLRITVYEQWGFRQKMNRGLGINALFAGESGTGKTMAAEVIANDLHLNLYRIDLSAVVSKYIGETEKNLRRLFDAAEDGGAILFFDEADALFGKRSEVKDSHDRYANIEINYLLQRMEAYRGLAILATNMKSALDPAFVRRLRFIVNLPFPGTAERKAIWQKAFPPQTPTAGLDFDRLARLNLTGGSIHNIALNAAFLAAQANTPVTMLLVLEAARTEFRKLERPINEADFRWQVAAGAVA